MPPPTRRAEGVSQLNCAAPPLPKGFPVDNPERCAIGFGCLPSLSRPFGRPTTTPSRTLGQQWLLHFLRHAHRGIPFLLRRGAGMDTSSVELDRRVRLPAFWFLTEKTQLHRELPFATRRCAQASHVSALAVPSVLPHDASLGAFRQVNFPLPGSFQSAPIRFQRRTDKGGRHVLSPLWRWNPPDRCLLP
jgi:hypothetical protein